MFILYRLTFPRGPVMKRVLQLESNQPAWAEWAWMNPAGLPSRAVYAVWMDFLYPRSFGVLFWERQKRSPVSEGAEFGNKLENPAHHLDGSNYSQIALDKRTKSPTLLLWKSRLKLPIDFKGSCVWVLEKGLQTPRLSVNIENHAEALLLDWDQGLTSYN